MPLAREGIPLDQIHSINSMRTMAKSKHYRSRMLQRGIRETNNIALVQSRDIARSRVRSRCAAAKLEQVLADSCIIIGKLFLSKKLLDFSVMLSDLEFALLHCLWRHRGDTVSYEIILQEWGNSDGPLKPSGTLFTNFIPMVWRSKLIMALATVWRYLRAKLSLRPKTPE